MAKRAKIRWVAHPELSAAHAAYVVAIGAECTDPKTEQLLVPPVADINSRLVSSAIDVRRFWTEYLDELIRSSDIGTACTVALMSAGCSEMQVEQTAKAVKSRLGEARSAFLGRYPKLVEQLELRARPLRDRWDTFGAGLLRDVERQIWKNSPPADWWPTRVTGLLVQPLRGGDGDYDGGEETFWIEAMLTDADPNVPEVLRIAWLITRMAIENHCRERSGETMLAAPWSLASVPLVLSSAANIELIRGEPLPIQQAMQRWHFGDSDVAKQVTRWWEEFQRTPAPLPVALRQLDHS